MAPVPLVALSSFEFQFSLAPLEPVVGVHDPFFMETPVKAYRRPTRKRGRRDDKTVKKLPSAFYFAHEPLRGKQYPTKISRPQGGLINKPIKKPLRRPTRARDSDEEDFEDSDIDMDGEKHENGESMTPIPSGRNALVEGGRPAAARPITANLDADDQVLVQMKLLGRPDKEIAEHLTNLGRVKYNMKTIGSRWKRLRIALAGALDEELDKKIAKWSEEEDAFLLQAFDLADQTVTRLKKEAEDSRWTVVAQKLKILKKNALYSVRACRERYEALQNGTATLPAVDSENLEQQTNEQNNGETNAERMDVDLVAPSGSVTRKDTRRRSGAPLVADEDEIISDGSSDLSDTEPTVNQHLSNLIKSGIDLSAITNLPFKAQVMSASIGRKAPDLGKNLKAVEDMNRDELREELRMRGLCSDGLRPKMAETLKAARAGNTDLKHSPKNAMNLSFRRPAKPVKKSAARRLSTILLSDAEKSGDEEDRDHKEGPKQKRAKTGSSSTAAADKQPVEDSSKAVVNEQPAPATMTNTEHLAPLINTEQLAPLINTEQFAPVSTKSTQQSAPVATTNNQAFQGPTLADEIFGLLYLPLAETNLQLVYQKEIEDGRRLFLSNVPPSFNADMIRTILNAYSLKAVHTLRATGNLVVDCADVETAVGVTSALDGLALKGQVIVVENAQVIAQKYFAARNQAPSTEAPSTQASTPVVGSVNNTPRPKMLTKKDSKSPSKIMCQLVVKNVPDSVDAMQLQQVFGKLQACEHIESGVWLMEFSDASSAERCYKTSQGQRVRGEILELDYYLPEASKVIRRRATKQEADMYDDAL